MKVKFIGKGGWFLAGWLAMIQWGCAYTPAYHHLTRAERAGSITEMNLVEFGGVNQSVLIRGENRDNPVLLFIHGGPGKAEMPLIRCFNPDLEKDFIVVTWDQRGAGKSNRILKPVDDFSFETYLNDTHEVICYLKEHLGKEKVFILGHSWGSLLGILIASRYPEDVYAHIGIGQMIGYEENIARSAEIALDLAVQKQDLVALEKLNRLKLSEGDLSKITNKDIMYLRKFLVHNTNRLSENSIYDQLVWRALWSAEYSVVDIIRYLAGIASAKSFLDQNNLKEINLYRLIPELEVPLFIMVGTEDIFTNRQTTKDYFDFVRSPLKNFYIFEQSTHFPVFEEVEKFNEVLRKDILPLAVKIH